MFGSSTWIAYLVLRTVRATTRWTLCLLWLRAIPSAVEATWQKSIQLDHRIRVDAEPGLALRRRLKMRPYMRARRIEVAEPGLAGLLVAVDEIERGTEKLFVNRLHALGVERAGVLDRLFPDLAPGRIDGGIVAIGGLASEHAARPKSSPKLRVLRVVGVLRLLLRIEVVEVAEELVEPMHRRQELVAVAEMVLAELPGRIAERLQRLGDRHVLGLQPHGGGRQSDLGQPGADGRLPGNECRAAGGTALLGIPVGEQRTLFGDTVDVGRPVLHHPHVVGADIEPADVVAHDHQDIRLSAARRGGSRRPLLLGLGDPHWRARPECDRSGQAGAAEEDSAAVQRGVVTHHIPLS